MLPSAASGSVAASVGTCESAAACESGPAVQASQPSLPGASLVASRLGPPSSVEPVPVVDEHAVSDKVTHIVVQLASFAEE